MRTGTIEEISQELKEKQIQWNESLIIKTDKHHIVITELCHSIIAGTDLDDISEIARKHGYSFYVGWDYCNERLEVVIH